MKKEKNKVSIILPVYNVDKYLNICADSIFKQNYKNLEIIFVDDGSTDNSSEILDELEKKDSRVRVFHKKNGGVSSAKNVGLKNCTGNYITFIDPDDYVLPDYISYLVDLIEKYNADISLSKAVFDNYDMNQNKKLVDKSYSSKEALVDILTYDINVAVWDKMYRRELLINNDILFYEDIFMGEGFNFNILAFKSARKIAVGNKKIYYYRRDNENSATTKFTLEKWENALFAIERIGTNLDLTDNIINRAYTFAKWRTNVDAFTLLCLSNNQKKYSSFYIKTKKIGKIYFYIPFIIKSSLKDKIRGISLLIYPQFLPKMMLLRRKIKGVKVNN